MKRLLLLLALLPQALFAQSVEAECGSKDQIFSQMFMKHKETKLEFLSLNELHGSRTFTAIYSNPETGSWTLVEYDEKEACVLGFGKREVL